MTSEPTAHDLAQANTHRHRSAANPAVLQVAVIGAGFGGIGMAAALRRTGITRFAVFERSGDIGGVWRDNTYPGCNCDVPAHLYSLPIAPYRDRHIRYPDQRAILNYLHRIVADEGLTPHLRSGIGITAATYLDDTGFWELVTDSGQTILTETVVFALGQLHRPHIPTLPGHIEFGGTTFHTARWNHDHPLTGRSVAVIGTGSSAAQILPSLADTAARVRVFQRTPHWVLPKPGPAFGPVTTALLAVPGAHHAYRRLLHHSADNLLAPIMRRGWTARPAEAIARRYLRHHISDAVMRAKLTPNYPLGGTRIVLDNGFYPSLRRPNVELITTPICELDTRGLITSDGTHHDADTIIYATGFHAPQFLADVTVSGRGGRLLHEQWAEGASAFYGMAVPGFPNLFLIAGPNSFTAAGSNPAMKQLQIDYILACLRLRAESGDMAIEVDSEAMSAYQEWMDRALQTTVWPRSPQSWYKHANGAVTNPWPATVGQYRKKLRRNPPTHCFTTIAHQPPTMAFAGELAQ
ncbi:MULTISPECIES: flavin-containing monooxygenase [Nocardia]|uniref:flavin-containing monooxygenase n=1 Tax=Nocardia TaxID=1817 RepID=UPI00245573F5|nr:MULTISPECIES: NAD(P)/FAD-dependent oxidoreductase [Nocardia]